MSGKERTRQTAAAAARRKTAKPKHDFMIWLRKDGASNREIADILGTTEPTVTNAFTRMRQAGRRIPPAPGSMASTTHPSTTETPGGASRPHHPKTHD